MDYTQFTAVKNQFSVSPNLCDLFKLLSIETWKRMEYSYLKAGVKVFETTITQNLIFSINAYNDQYGLNIEILEAQDENTNGNDLELIIRYPNEGIEFYAPIQAKKVYRDGKYLSMEHGNQINTLINYARANRAKPYYLLYNYTADLTALRFSGYNNNEIFGCTLISAEHLFDNYYDKRISKSSDGSIVNKWEIPKFQDLHPVHAIPWHELIAQNSIHYLINLLQDIKVLPEPPIVPTLTGLMNANQRDSGFFPIGTFQNVNGWINIRDLNLKTSNDISYNFVNSKRTQYKMDNYGEEGNKKQKSFPAFSPKSRIVITKEQ